MPLIVSYIAKAVNGGDIRGMLEKMKDGAITTKDMQKH